VTTILHVAVEGDRNTFREHSTWSWFERNDKAIGEAGWTVGHCLVRKGEGHDYDYDGLVRHFWGKDDLLIFERDMVPNSFDELKRLIDCPEPACAQDYPLVRCYILELESMSGRTVVRGDPKKGHPALTHTLVCVAHQQKLSMMRNATNQGQPNQGAVWNDGTWTHCDVPPLGLTKIRREVMLRIPALWPRTHWLDVDQMVGNTLSMNGVKTHIHYPMARHMRRFAFNECAFVATLPRKYPIVTFDDVLPEYRARLKWKHGQVFEHTAFPLVQVP
jgi:hypothetical protein